MRSAFFVIFLQAEIVINRLELKRTFGSISEIVTLSGSTKITIVSYNRGP